MLVLRKMGTVAEDAMSFEVLYDNPYFVAAGTKNPLTRRRHVELAELIGEPWVLPPADTRFGLLARDIFSAKGLACPRPALIATSIEMINNMLRTGRYLAIHPESVLTFPTGHPFIKRLAVELPVVSGPIGILTMKNRILSPAAQLFIDTARDVAKPLVRKKS
jgi:DNA-binding transcriptional LysR family regulator